MIKHFSVFCCGQVDHSEYGAGAPEVGDRFYSPDEIASIFETAGMTAKHMVMPAFASRREPAVAGDDGNGC